MRFFATASALMATITAAVAQTADFNPVYTPTSNQEIAAGAPFQITWSAPAKYADGTISISLIGGATQGSQVPIADIASGIPNTDQTYTWTVDASLGDAAVYGLVFKLDSDPSIFQYSNPFHIKAGSGEASQTGEGPVVVTTSAGVKTVTLTSCPPTETSTTVAPTTTSVALNTTSVEITTLAPPTSTLITTTKFENTSTPVVVPTLPPTTLSPPPAPTTVLPPPATVPSGTPESGAVRFGSAMFAVVGGVAAALLL